MNVITSDETENTIRVKNVEIAIYANIQIFLINSIMILWEIIYEIEKYW